MPPLCSSRPVTLALTGLVAGALAVLGPGAVQATPAPTTCPAAYDPADLTLGEEVTGLTTAGSYRRGTDEHDSSITPESFTGRYRGTIEDESGDLLVFELEGSRVTDTDGSVDAGVWAGMSGSPLYAAGGRLVGAVSYGFSGTSGSRFAGVTPAADLYALLSRTAPVAPRRVLPDTAQQRQLARAGVPRTVSSAGLTRLDPVTVLAGTRGIRPAALARIAKLTGRASPLVAGGTGTQGRSIPLVPGGNLAVADSYGSVAMYGLGTVAAICDGSVIGFGHPGQWAPSTRTIHGAATTFIQEDGAWSAKIGNLAAPEGTLVGDRLAGVVGRLGTLPASATVTTTTYGPHPRTSVSTVPNRDALAYVTATQVYRDTVLTLDQDAGGSAQLSWTIGFVRADGRRATFTRSQRYSAVAGLGDQVVGDVANDVMMIGDNDVEAVRITDVSVSVTATPDYRALKVGRIRVKSGKHWRTLDPARPAKVRAGRTLAVRVRLLAPPRSMATPVTATKRFSVPKRARGKARLLVRGNAQPYDVFGGMLDGLTGFGEEGGDAPEESVGTLEELLKQLSKAPRQDTLTIRLRHRKADGTKRTVVRAWRAPAVVTGLQRAKLPIARH